MGPEPSLVDQRIIAALQGDLPVTAHPFAAAAREAGISEEELLDRLREFQKRGWLRRVAAILYHQRAGVTANAMAVWQVPEERVEEAGRRAAAFPQVSHCYERIPYPQWPYNLYAMIHGFSEAECRRTAEEISRAIGIEEPLLLFSQKEFKKTSMEYF
ncbi:MAG: Lrp/AsnC family transcriptional regulator [Firmicutes bacterium]|nr:Lrp/AsnC family transcriptional regulator [Bacillota bacterium]MCL5039939.1 Lrp/AsnC family transcriptional regulator [Bacillota bacterium]